MHGEYRVPGGQLVAVDLEVSGGRLASVAVGVDVQPSDDTLERVAAALEGLPADADGARLTALIEAELPAGAGTAGLPPYALALAVRRALSHATNWDDHDWRLIHTGPQEPALHMALDEVLTREVVAGRRPPTLRIWEWASPAVVLGSFQSLRNEVDAAAATRYGITVVRRISGGGAMFVEPDNTVTYSLHAPISLVRGLSVVDSYAFLDDWVLATLAELGIIARHQPINDIASAVGKIAGAAQRRFASGGLLHHLTMAYDIDPVRMAEVLRFGREPLPGPGTRSVRKRVDPLNRQTTRSRAEIIDRMVAIFRRRYGLTEDELRPDELRAAEKLVVARFGTREWTARLP